MDTKTREQDTADRPQLTLIERVLSLSELCAHLQVPAQTLYDLRSQGRGPRAYSVTETAQVLGCAEGTVKTHLSRGRATVAPRLEIRLDEEVVR